MFILKISAHPPIEEEQDSAKRTTTAVDMNVSMDFCPNDHPKHTTMSSHADNFPIFL